MIRPLTEGFLNLIFPPNCLVCRRLRNPQEILCSPCRDKILLNHPPFCRKCSRLAETGLCGPCRDRPPEFDFAWSACIYDEFLKHLLLQFKYHHKTACRHLFARLMIHFIEEYGLDIRQFDSLVPVPLFASRWRQRGYNQSLFLAEAIGHAYQIPVDKNILQRIRPTPSQTHLSRKDRWTNVSGAFRIKPNFDVQALKNKKILVIDDLLTTGATASEAARTLKSSGAKLVGVLTLATAI